MLVFDMWRHLGTVFETFMKWKTWSGQVGPLELKSRWDFCKIHIVIMVTLRNKSVFVPDWTPGKVRKFYIIQKCCVATFQFTREFRVCLTSRAKGITPMTINRNQLKYIEYNGFILKRVGSKTGTKLTSLTSSTSVVMTSSSDLLWFNGIVTFAEKSIRATFYQSQQKITF